MSSVNSGSNNGKGKKKQPAKEDNTANGEQKGKQASSKDDVYSYSVQDKGKGGARRAQQRIRGARQDVSQSFQENGKGKGKQKARDNDDDDDEADSEYGGYGDIADYRDVKFKLGLASDEEDGGSGLPQDDEDEEIDSDYASTDGEEIQAKKQSRQNIKKAKTRQVATDFYSDNDEDSPEEPDIDLDEESVPKKRKATAEDDEDEDDDDEYDGGGWTDLSEILRRNLEKEKRKQQSKSKTSSKASTSKAADLDDIKEADVEDEDEDLRLFKPGQAGLNTGKKLAGVKVDDVDMSQGDSEAEDEEEDASDDDEESEEDDDDDFSESEEEDENALTKLGDLVDGLSAKRRLTDDTETLEDASNTVEADPRQKRRRLLQRERTEVVPEGSYNAGPDASKLTIDMLLSSLDPAQASSLKKSLKPLISANRSATVDGVNNAIEAELSRLTADEQALLKRERSSGQGGKSSNPLKAAGALPAPLAPLHQAKIERQAAREKMDEKVKEWDDTVKYMKGVNRSGEDDPENRLDLKTLNDSQGKGKGITSAELVAKFNPSNDLERHIASLVAATGASQADLLATENSALMEALPNKSTEESKELDRARVAQLRLARELMFRAERKAKRVAKIKSRTFRKIAKKSRERQALKDGIDGEMTLDEMAELDAMDGGARAEAERERLETLRTRERATLRHASGMSGATAGGKWSRGLRGMDDLNDEIRESIKARDNRQEILRRKVMGYNEQADSDDSGDEQSSDSEVEQDEDAIKAEALSKIKQIGEQPSEAVPSKGVMGMKFMQRAMARDEGRVQEMVDDFDMQMDPGQDDGTKIEGAISGGDLVSNNPGRMVFAPSASAGKKVPQQEQQITENLSQRAKKRLNAMARTNGNVSTASTAPLSASSSATLLDYNPFSSLTGGALSNGHTDAQDKANPWLSLDVDAAGPRLSSKTNTASVEKDSKDADKIKARLTKTQGRTKEALAKARSDATIEVNLDDVLSAAAQQNGTEASSPYPATSPREAEKRKKRELAPPPSSSQAPQLLSSQDNTASNRDDEDEEDNDSDDLPEAVKRNQGPNAFKQRDLVARAFAGDNVVTDFQEMKRAEIEADAPREEDLTMPGWGAWGGKGVRKAQKEKQKKIIKHVPGLDASERKDAKFDHVILSERTAKKAQKYLTKDLPYPYTSIRQYEQKLAQPTGVEWNTRGTFKEMTTPRVLTRPGTVIKPVSRKM